MMAELCIQHQVPYGLAVYVAHSLNGWSLNKALKLQWNEGHLWKGSIPTSGTFEYKFVMASYEDRTEQPIWERGRNRRFKITQKKQIDHWESRKINLKLLDKKRDPTKRQSLILISGSCGSLESPVKMDRVVTRQREKYYFVSFIVSIDEISQGINYQYHILSQDRYGSGITEIITPVMDLATSARSSASDFKMQACC